MPWKISAGLVSLRLALSMLSAMAKSMDGAHGVLHVRGALTDAAHRDIRLSSRGTPLLLTPGQNELTYYVVPERTAAPLIAGAYQAHIDFWLNYD